MLDVLIFLKSSGAAARLDNLQDTMLSVKSKIGIENYAFYIVVDPWMLDGVSQIIKNTGLQDKIFTLISSDNSWAYDYNLFLTSVHGETDWIMTAHDDLSFRTNNFFPKIVNMVGNKRKEIGWITATIDYYYRQMGEPVPCSGRELFCLDRVNYPLTFECHRFVRELHNNGRAKQNLHLLDMPDPNKLVRVPGVMSAVMLTTTESALNIGPCEDWTKYTILIDEDWSLESQKKNLWNLWASGIYIDHPLRANLRTVWNRWEKEAHAGFLKKWGFKACTYPEEDIRDIRIQFKDTNIPWSSYRNTFDWSYL